MSEWSKSLDEAIKNMKKLTEKAKELKKKKE